MNLTTEWISRAKEIISANNIKPDEIAKIIGVTPANVRHYLNARRTPPLDKLDALANALGVTPQYLLFGDNNGNDIIFKLPLIDWNNINNKNSNIKITPPVYVSKNGFALCIKDDSMRNFYESYPTFPSKTIIIVDPEITPKSGKFVLARLLNSDEEPIFRKYIKSTEGVKLHPLNGALYDVEDASKYEIVGCIVASMSLYL